MALPAAAQILAWRAQARTAESVLDVERSARGIWPYIAQHNLSAQVMGKPPPHVDRLPPEGGLNQLVRSRWTLMGMKNTQVELPHEWSTGLYWCGELLTESRTARYQRIEVHVDPLGEQRARVTTRISYFTRGPGLLMRFMCRTISRLFAEGYRKIDATAPKDDVLRVAPYLDTSADVRRQAAALASSWHALLPGRIPEAVAEYVLAAPNALVRRIRPFSVADDYRLPRLDVLRFMLLAVKNGHLDMSWDLMCPSCRGASQQAPHLHDLMEGAHCASCNIQYSADLDRNVEVTFRPVARIRPTDDVDYCSQSQGNTPHVWAQVNVAPGERRTLPLRLDPGEYRLHSLTMRGNVLVTVGNDGCDSLELTVSGDDMPEPREARLSPGSSLVVHNQGLAWRTLRLDRRAFRDVAATAFNVTTMQDFRDQFGAEVLRPGVQLGISNVAILFTDLKDSTALYETRGDAQAFSLVQSHFDIMIGVIRKHEGCIVKTIGDAVMAAFPAERDAVAAGLEILRAFEAWNRAHGDTDRIVVKLGLHAGPCIALNLNERLDYFGQNVNKAARIQGTARGGELVLSERILEVVGTEAILALDPTLRTERFQITLKGIQGQSALLRVSPAASEPTSAELT